MSDKSGQPVTLDDIDLGAAAPPMKDIDRLINYITNRFATRDEELMTLHQNAATLKLKNDLITLGFAAIDFRREVSGWLALARRLRVEMYASELDSSHEERTQEAQSRDLKRADSTLIKSRAESNIAPLTEAIERLEATRDEMKGIVSWCQTQQNSLRDEEFGDVFESNHDVPDELYRAPLGAALQPLTRQS